MPHHLPHRGAASSLLPCPLLTFDVSMAPGGTAPRALGSAARAEPSDAQRALAPSDGGRLFSGDPRELWTAVAVGEAEARSYFGSPAASPLSAISPVTTISRSIP